MRRDTQFTKIFQPGNDRVKGAFGRKCADMDFIKHQVCPRHAPPVLIGPGEPVRENHRRRPIDVPLAARANTDRAARGRRRAEIRSVDPP